MEFSCDNKFLFSAGGDNLIKQISCLTFKVVWIFEYHTLQPHTILPLPTSPRFISVSSQEIMIINYRSKLVEFNDLNPSSAWTNSRISSNTKQLFLYNSNSKYLNSMDLSVILDHRISLERNVVVDLERIENFSFEDSSETILTFNSNKVTILKPNEKGYQVFKEIKLGCKSFSCSHNQGDHLMNGISSLLLLCYGGQTGQSLSNQWRNDSVQLRRRSHR